jgi:NADH-quinone oxidoreductase subunit E
MSHHADKLLSAGVRAEIDTWIAKYPDDQKQSAVMAALRIVQDDNGGWLSTELMDAVAEYLDMPPIAVYEVATFYSMYDTEPTGRHKVCVCNSISCMLNGSGELIHHLEKKLGVEVGGTTEDGRITLKEVECLGACKDAPVVQIGREYHERLTTESIDKLVDGLE